MRLHKWLSDRFNGRRSQERAAALTEEDVVRSLTYEAARRLAYERLERGDGFHVEPASPGRILPEELPPGLKELFQRYRSIYWEGGAAHIDLGEWTALADRPGWYAIGDDAETPLAFARLEEAVYRIDSSGRIDSFPSIYHWLVALEGLKTPDADPEE